MNAGFSNLDWLKKSILAATLKNDLRFDPLILALGLGVAGQFEKYCARKFMRTTGATQVFGADRASFLLERFPVEAPIALVEYKQDEPTGWAIVPQVAGGSGQLIQSLDTDAGIIYFSDNVDCGDYWSQMRFTYTGGYWWEQLEPDDAAYPSVMPASAAVIPDSLKLAWLLQCKHIWALNDKVGTDLLKDGTAKSLRFPEEFSVSVEKTLNDFVRPNFT